MLARFVIHALPKRPGVAHWRSLHSQKKAWAGEFVRQNRERFNVPQARMDDPLVVVRVILEHKGRAYDQDNAMAMMKVPLDALQRAGILWDDAPAYCRVVVEDRPYAGIERTTIELVEADEYDSDV